MNGVRVCHRSAPDEPAERVDLEGREVVVAIDGGRRRREDVRKGAADRVEERRVVAPDVRFPEDPQVWVPLTVMRTATFSPSAMMSSMS